MYFPVVFFFLLFLVPSRQRIRTETSESQQFPVGVPNELIAHENLRASSFVFHLTLSAFSFSRADTISLGDFVRVSVDSLYETALAQKPPMFVRHSGKFSSRQMNGYSLVSGYAEYSSLT